VPDGVACSFPYGSAIVCGVNTSEVYMLAPINQKLRFYPRFAAAAGLDCVTDCATARAFMAAYRKYSAEHPGFDINEPSPPLPSPPHR
jgi:hypothetical protein